MPTLSAVMSVLKAKATEQTRKTYVRHGAPAERTLGVSVADMKLIAKGIRRQQALACELYATGIFEAMYLAGMIADGSQMSAEELQDWVEGAVDMPMIYEHTVPWVAVESKDARGLAMKWIASKKEHVAAAGWRTYAGIVTTMPDGALDLVEIAGLLNRISTEIAEARNRVRSTMNGFVISVGGYVSPLHEDALEAARRLGVVSVDVGDTACKIPVATDYIAKMHASGRTAKRKTIRC